MGNTITTLVFTAPGALDTAVVGTQRGTTISIFDFNVPVSIQDATHEVDPAATIQYDFGIRRGTDIKVISQTVDMLRANRPTQGFRPGFPSRAIAPGQFEFVILQRAGALTATNIRLIANKPVF